MANPIRLSRPVSKLFSSSKVAPVARQKLENRHKKQKHDPQGQAKPHLKKKRVSKKQDGVATPSGKLSPKDGSKAPPRKRALTRRTVTREI